MKFKTHPNAPVVINFRGNKDRFLCKYSSEANADWMLKTMQWLAPSREWYIHQR